MKKIEPSGNWLLVEQLSTENYVTDGGIEAVANDLKRGKVSCVGDAVAHYTPLDVVIFPDGSGINEIYNGKPHLWLQSHEIMGREVDE